MATFSSDPKIRRRQHAAANARQSAEALAAARVVVPDVPFMCGNCGRRYETAAAAADCRASWSPVRLRCEKPGEHYLTKAEADAAGVAYWRS